MTTALSAPERKALAEIIGDDQKAIETLFQIPPKQALGARVPFVLKPAQQKIMDQMALRTIIVKPGQIGSTSVITGIFFRRTMFRPDTTSVIVAHESFLTERLLNRTQVFYQSVPEIIRPRMDHQSATEKRFPDINSVMYIGTARAAVFGRGEPIHNLLFSEPAFYPEEAIHRIVLPSIERVPVDGTIFIESTPNGEGGYFYDEVQAALEGKSVYKLIVLYWWEEPDNFLPPDSPVLEGHPEIANDFEYTPEEIVLVETNNLSLGQMRWRRWKIMGLGDLFWQEHLESLDSCFLQMGLPYYDSYTTNRLTKETSKPIASYNNAKVWEEPIAGAHYVMGVDPGMARRTESVAWVVRVDNSFLLRPRCVALLAGMYETDVMGKMCVNLGKYYNLAMMIPESNNHGVGFINEIRGKYPRVYMSRDVRSGQTIQRMGWATTPSSKPFMLEEMNRRLRNIEIPDAETVRQIRGFRHVEGGRAETLIADDRHDALCLALMGLVGKTPGAHRGFKGSSGHTGWDK